MVKRTINFTILLLVIVNLGSYVYSHRETYTTPYDIDYWQKEFSDSQLVLGGKARHFFSDYELYAISGYKYILGENPIKYNQDVPPLGKELIGLSIVLFRNQNISSLLLGLGSLAVIFFIALEIFNNYTLALLTVLLSSFNSEFKHLLLNSNVDIPQLFFICLSILFFLKSQKKQGYYFISAVFVGLVMATKIYINGFILLSTYLIYILVNGDFGHFIKSVLSLPLVIVSYCVPYAVTLRENPNPIDFIRFHRGLTAWWAGNVKVDPGGILLIISSGWWRTWWEGPEFIRVAEWNLLWPLITLLGLVSIFFMNRKRNKLEFFLWLWSSIYLLFISTTPYFPRYLIAIFPFLGLLTIFVIIHLFSKGAKILTWLK